MTPFKCYYVPQNTGWSGGISWFDTGGAKYESLEEAQARNKIRKDGMRDPSIRFRVKYVMIRETYYYD